MLATDRQTNKQMDSIAALKCGLIIVKFQLRSYINLRLTESSLYNRFCIERSTKMGFWGVFWVDSEDILWEPTSVLRIARFQTCLVQI